MVGIGSAEAAPVVDKYVDTGTIRMWKTLCITLRARGGDGSQGGSAAGANAWSFRPGQGHAPAPIHSGYRFVGR